MYKIVIILLICGCTTAYGAEVDNSLLKKNLDAANLQIEVLKTQIEVMKSYQDRFLNIVTWSISIVMSILSLIAGFNWYTNTKNLEKELEVHKEMMANEWTALKQEIHNQLESNLSTKFNRKIESLGAEQLEIKRELLNIEYEKWMTNGVLNNAMSVAADILVSSNSDYSTRKAFDKINDVLKAMKDTNQINCLDSYVKTQLSRNMEKYREKYNHVIENINRKMAEFEREKQ